MMWRRPILGLIMATCAAAAPGKEAMNHSNNPAPPGAVVKLWSQGAPGAKGDGLDDVPTLSVFLPPGDKANGTAVVICPGGGYGGLAFDYEGEDVARWLNTEGIAGFVLRYRHAPGYRHPYPLMDAHRAIRTVRARAGEWKVKTDRIGILGFSAGGHLTTTAATLYDAGDPASDDPVERVSSRPDFMVPVYPVVAMTGPYAHLGSRQNLLGPSPDPALMDRLSPEKQVTRDTPPAFIVHTAEDGTVPVQNSVMLFLALREKGVAAELHCFQKGVHGLGMGKGDPAMSTWPGQLITWLRANGLIPPVE